MNVRFISSIHNVQSQDWNEVTGREHPFMRHEFFAALEDSGSTGEAAGWQTQHIVVENKAKDIIAVMPLYIKTHSHGEFVFDWSWADAYHRAGLHYYPKLLTAIPFTPATGPRLCIKDVSESCKIRASIFDAAKTLAEEVDASSWHLLFNDETDCQQWDRLGISRRLGVQFHWFNQGYKSFDDFLSTFTSRKRKQIKRERNRVREQGLKLQTIEGTDITPEHLQTFYTFYQLTNIKYSGYGGYLSDLFFYQLSINLADHMVMILVTQENQYVAGSLFLKSEDTLFGRYWGCIKEFDFLHFETCYYQGIEYCIKHGLSRFDPGAQGEHKIKRGFAPIRTWSNHWIKHPRFAKAIGDFLVKEEARMTEYQQDAMALLPFKKS